MANYAPKYFVNDMTIDAAAVTSAAAFSTEYESIQRGATGERGERGEKGETGERGADFKYTDFTAEQLEALRGERGKDGADGKDGKDGYTPRKNIDYFDGKDGQDGKNGSDYVITAADYAAIAQRVPLNDVVRTNDARLTDARTPKPHTHTEYAAAADIPTDAHINSLIDAKLGVIENGAY